MNATAGGNPNLLVIPQRAKPPPDSKPSPSACLGVIIPVFNEGATMETLLGRVLAQPCVREVVVVDDGSTDGAVARFLAGKANDPRVLVVRHSKNRGKGAAIRTGLAEIQAPVVLVQDADLEYDPSDYERLLQPILSGEAAIVYGSRFMLGTKPHAAWWHRTENRLLTGLSNFLTGVPVTDMATCYKIFRREVLQRLRLEENRFGFCQEVTAKLGQLGLRVKEVPIAYAARSRAEGKKIRFRDGLEAIRCLFKYSFFPLTGPAPDRQNKSSKTGKVKPYLVSYALFLALVLGLWAAFPQRVHHVQLNNQMVALPWFAAGQPQVYDFVAEVTGPRQTLSVRADDCVEQLDVNGVMGWKTNCVGCLHCAYSDLPLVPALGAGLNRVTFHVRDLGGEAWFDIKEAHGFTLGRVMLIAGLGLAAFGLALRLGLSPWLVWPVALGLLVAIQYLEVTTPWLRQHDVGAHREYVDHLLKTGALPAMLQGWETWQPPLYYLVAAGWRLGFPGSLGGEAYASVQVLALCLYLLTIGLALVGGRLLGLNKVELFSALASLALLPGHLFFAARINNDVLLPILGLGITVCVCRYAQSGNRKLLIPLALLLAASLATKPSSVAVVGGALLAIGLADVIKGRPWLEAGWRSYLAALPSLLWFAFWGLRSQTQTGAFLYANASLLSENMRIVEPMFSRFFAFAFQPYFAGHWHYDPDISSSYPTALLTSVLYGEYTLADFRFRGSVLFRGGCLGLLLALVAGFLVRPRPEVRVAWATCLALALPQLALIVAYAIQYPFTCNQNIRFAAQAFFPLACLWGLGIGHFWHAGWLARGVIGLWACGLAAGLIDFYGRLLF